MSPPARQDQLYPLNPAISKMSSNPDVLPTTPMTTHLRQFPFLRLPAEIRQKVYKYLFRASTVTMFWLSYQEGKRAVNIDEDYSAITLTSHLIRSESHDLLDQGTTFVITDSCMNSTFEGYLRRRQPEVLRRIQRLRYVGDTTGERRTLCNPQSIIGLFPGLKTLEYCLHAGLCNDTQDVLLVFDDFVYGFYPFFHEIEHVYSRLGSKASGETIRTMAKHWETGYHKSIAGSHPDLKVKLLILADLYLSFLRPGVAEPEPLVCDRSKNGVSRRLSVLSTKIDSTNENTSTFRSCGMGRVFTLAA
jgi:hypothetical protein